MFEIIETLRAYPLLLQGIGVFGFLLYVGTFSAIQSGLLCGNGVIFPINQVTAASCVLISLVGAFNLSAFLIQVSYICIGTFGIIKRAKRERGDLSQATQHYFGKGTELASSV